MMFVTSKHVLEIKKCRNLLKDNDLSLSLVLPVEMSGQMMSSLDLQESVLRMSSFV